MGKPTFAAVILKTTITHTVTYFLTGLLAFIFLDYAAVFNNPAVANFMRQPDNPLVAAGPLFQILRGILFGIAIFVLREIVLARRNGWLVFWLMLAIMGILSTFGASPGSIEGMIYTVLPLWFHFVGLPEIVIQSLLLAFLSCYWINHPEKKWLNWVFGAAFVMVLLMSTLGVLAGLGMLRGS